MTGATVCDTAYCRSCMDVLHGESNRGSCMEVWCKMSLLRGREGSACRAVLQCKRWMQGLYALLIPPVSKRWALMATVDLAVHPTMAVAALPLSIPPLTLDAQVRIFNVSSRMPPSTPTASALTATRETLLLSAQVSFTSRHAFDMHVMSCHTSVAVRLVCCSRTGGVGD